MQYLAAESANFIERLAEMFQNLWGSTGFMQGDVNTYIKAYKQILSKIKK